jgi:hypothetical protein
MQVKPGMRVRSAVCPTEVMVVKGAGDLDLRCGGVPMQVGSGAPTGEPQAPFDGGTLVGKRYSLGDVELLCTKAGAGSLSLGETPIPPQDAQQLPSSD